MIVLRADCRLVVSSVLSFLRPVLAQRTSLCCNLAARQAGRNFSVSMQQSSLYDVHDRDNIACTCSAMRKQRHYADTEGRDQVLLPASQSLHHDQS